VQLQQQQQQQQQTQSVQVGQRDKVDKERSAQRFGEMMHEAMLAPACYSFSNSALP